MSEQYFTRPNVQPVITNIGTTPEQRQMSTSEFKAKFDEMPEAIQQYIKETLLTELDAFKQDFMTHQAESASKHITESGSNANGSYIKFDDGTMVCFKNLHELAFTSVSYCQSPWIFPASFFDSPSVSSSIIFSISKNPSKLLGVGSWSTSSTQSSGIRVYDSSNGFIEGDKVVVIVIAIGRWKQ